MVSDLAELLEHELGNLAALLWRATGVKTEHRAIAVTLVERVNAVGKAALASRRNLARLDSSNVAWMFDLSSAYELTGDVRREQRGVPRRVRPRERVVPSPTPRLIERRTAVERIEERRRIPTVPSQEVAGHADAQRRHPDAPTRLEHDDGEGDRNTEPALERYLPTADSAADTLRAFARRMLTGPNEVPTTGSVATRAAAFSGVALLLVGLACNLLVRPVAEKYYDSALTLPLYPSMSDADCARVIDAVIKAVR